MAERKRPREEPQPASSPIPAANQRDTRPLIFPDFLLQMRSVDGAVVGDSLLLPAFGLGTFRMKGPSCRKAVEHAVKNGCRHIDTASSYNNESDVAVAVAAASVGLTPAGRVIITTKVPRGVMGKSPEAIKASVMGSCAALKRETLDVLLLHWPGTDNTNVSSPLHRRARIAAWRVLEELHAAGVAAIIGVSNFTVQHIEQLIEDGARMIPAINQVEVHPYLPQKALREFCNAKKIHVQAYCSLGRCDEPPRCLYGNYEPSHPKLVRDPLVLEMAVRTKLTAPQLLLLYSLQNGLSVVPKSQKTEHYDENSRVVSGGRRLSESDIALLDKIPPPAAEVFAYAYPLTKVPA
jgi:diketogulonate reductase-like aldo/keto reductase